jgi:trimeric autotransporter adhesin
MKPEQRVAIVLFSTFLAAGLTMPDRVAFGQTSPGIITTLAGGKQGFIGDGGPAATAELALPAGMVVDASGNLYIVDSCYGRIRRVDASTGIITTVAGSSAYHKGSMCTFAFSGDGEQATSAELNGPEGVAVDADGNLFIADTRNNRIRRVDHATGIITTVAGKGTGAFSGDGGPATSAELNLPSGVSVDRRGNLFIADLRNNRIRRVDGVTGIVSTVAGDGTRHGGQDGMTATQVGLDLPTGVLVDAAGDLFVADMSNHCIRRVDHVTGIITTVAGTTTYGFTGDGGPATNAKLYAPKAVAKDASGNLFIADYGNHRIRRVDHATGIISTVAGDGARGFSGDGGPATSAELSIPSGVAVDSHGNLVISDTGNNRIRRVQMASVGLALGSIENRKDSHVARPIVTPSIVLRETKPGVITTVAGGPSQGIGGDGEPATQAQLGQPSGVAVDSSGNLLIADPNNSRIRRVDGATGLIATVVGDHPCNNRGLCVAGFGGDGGPAIKAELNYPWAVAVGGDGSLFIADMRDERIRRVDGTTGIITTVAGDGTRGFSGDGGPATSAKLNSPSGVSVDKDGNVFIADQFNGRIRRVDRATGIITTVAGGGTQASGGDDKPAIMTRWTQPAGVFVDSSGDLFIADVSSSSIRRVDHATGIITTVAGGIGRGFSGDGGPATDAKLYLPMAVAKDASGNLLIADNGNNRIRRVDHATGIITTVAGNGTKGFGGDDGPAASAKLDYPMTIAADAHGNVFIADMNNNRIRRVQIAAVETAIDNIGHSDRTADAATQK